MNKYELYYKQLLRSIFNEGISRKTRTGETLAIFNQQLTVDYTQGFPLLTGRKIFIKNVVAEFQWMLSGSTNVKFLQDRNVHIWDQWADEDGELGPVYGYQLHRQWDIIKKEILKNPIGRRHLIDLWQVDYTDKMALPPCWYSLQFIVIGNKLNLTVIMRSCDAAVGLPYDIPLFSLLLHEMALQTSYEPGSLTTFFTDLHINVENLNGVRDYLGRSQYALPTLVYNSSVDLSFKNYYSEPHIKMTVKP